jgi:hypothetical protein
LGRKIVKYGRCRPKLSFKASFFTIQDSFGRVNGFNDEEIQKISQALFLRGTVLETGPIQKIDDQISASHVFFLKAYIKFSFLANFQNFWTLPH